MTARDVICAGLMITGALWMLIAALGIARMPDFYLRVSAAAKASTLGAGSLLAGAALHFGELEIAARAAAIFAFVLLTTPVAAHVLCRAAYRSGVPLWKETLYDELAKAENTEHGEQASSGPDEPRDGPTSG